MSLLDFMAQKNVLPRRGRRRGAKSFEQRSGRCEKPANVLESRQLLTADLRQRPADRESRQNDVTTKSFQLQVKTRGKAAQPGAAWFQAIPIRIVHSVLG
jgi:hypothetical protein